LRRPDGNGMYIWTQLDAVRKELEIMKQINHKNCIKTLEIIEDESGESSNKIYVIMELANLGVVQTWDEKQFKFDANQNLKCGSFLDQKVVAKIIKDLAEGLDYLHNTALIVHRDIKPQNILLTQENG
jgi:serine/threonine protein kinase